MALTSGRSSDLLDTRKNSTMSSTGRLLYVNLLADAPIETGLIEMICSPDLTGDQTFMASSFSSPTFERNLCAAIGLFQLLRTLSKVKLSEGLVMNHIVRDDVMIWTGVQPYLSTLTLFLTARWKPVTFSSSLPITNDCEWQLLPEIGWIQWAIVVVSLIVWIR